MPVNYEALLKEFIVLTEEIEKTKKDKKVMNGGYKDKLTQLMERYSELKDSIKKEMGNA